MHISNAYLFNQIHFLCWVVESLSQVPAKHCCAMNCWEIVGLHVMEYVINELKHTHYTGEKEVTFFCGVGEGERPMY